MKLHLGCGKRYLEGYVHIDIVYFEHIDFVSKVDKLDMVEDGTVSEIYASHVLEYYDRQEVITVLDEWNRVLMKNGILRLSVPNFESLKKIYNSTKNLDNILGPLFGRWEVGDNEVIYHKTVYDFDSLSMKLKESGFKDIKIWDWKQVFKNNLLYDDHSQAYFPHMDKENGIQVSLNIECKKT